MTTNTKPRDWYDLLGPAIVIVATAVLIVMTIMGG